MKKKKMFYCSISSVSQEKKLSVIFDSIKKSFSFIRKKGKKKNWNKIYFGILILHIDFSLEHSSTKIKMIQRRAKVRI